MNKIKRFFPMFSLIAMLLFAACATTYDAPERTAIQEKEEYRNKRVKVISNPLSLEDFLIRAPGVVIQGNRVSIRGGGPPLFIIDEVMVGHSYAGVVNAINPNDIESVEVLSGPDTAFYGRRGANGVVIIRTRSL